MAHSFANLKALDIEGKTAEYTLTFSVREPVPGEPIVYPTLTVRPATEANPAFANEQLKLTKKNAPLVRAGAFSTAMIRDNRDNDRVLYAKYVICGWNEIYDSNGEKVPFSSDECAAFLEALPDYLFDQIREFCSSPANFSEQVADEVIAKNSPRG